MKIQIVCSSCGNKMKIEYDETECTPEFCPFCCEELSDDDGDYDRGPVSIDSQDWD